MAFSNIEKAHYLIIGAGRASRHIQYYMSLLGLSHTVWSRSRGNSALTEYLQSATHILLLISDSAIQDFYETQLKSWQGSVVHFSGALELPHIESAHPLMTFGPDLYPFDFYKKIPFITTTSNKNILPGFPNAFHKIYSEQKAYYHALCVLGGNLTSILTNRMLQGFDELGLPQELSHAFLYQSIQNVFQSSGQSFTGPMARKDALTVKRNLASLHGDAFENVYRSFLPIVFPEFKENLK